MEETWKPVAGYEGRYEVSNAGRVRRLFYRVLTPCDFNGYAGVTLSKGGEHRFTKVHRLVAEAFIPNPESKPDVNHINFDKRQNNVENLEWCTVSENVQHNYNHAKTKLQKRVRCISDGKVFVSQSAAARHYGISQQMVSALCRGTRSAAGVPNFEYCSVW